MVLLSLIIPIYNSEKFLNNILNKLKTQIDENTEVLLIDDGSNDNSLEICKKYAKNNLNFKLVHQKNKGASAARNNGISKAKGEFIAFLDSDDNITDDYIKVISELCKNTNSDIIQLDYYYGANVDEYSLQTNNLNQGTISYEDFCEFLLAQNSNPPWNKIYRRSSIVNNNILFDEDMTMGEDILFTLNVMKKVNSIQIEHKSVYFYLNNIDGLCANVNITYLDDLDKLYYNMKKFIEIKKLDDICFEIMQNSMLNSFFRAIGLCINNGCSIENIDEKINSLKNINELKDNKFYSFSNIIRKFLIKNKMYKLISKIIILKHK